MSTLEVISVPKIPTAGNFLAEFMSLSSEKVKESRICNKPLLALALHTKGSNDIYFASIA